MPHFKKPGGRCRVGTKQASKGSSVCIKNDKYVKGYRSKLYKETRGEVPRGHQNHMMRKAITTTVKRIVLSPAASRDAFDHWRQRAPPAAAAVLLLMRIHRPEPAQATTHAPAASNLRAPTRPMARAPTGNAKTHSTPSHDDGVEHKELLSPPPPPVTDTMVMQLW